MQTGRRTAWKEKMPTRKQLARLRWVICAGRALLGIYRRLLGGWVSRALLLSPCTQPRLMQAVGLYRIPGAPASKSPKALDAPGHRHGCR